MTGIDASPSNVQVATVHASLDPLLNDLQYKCMHLHNTNHCVYLVVYLGIASEELAKQLPNHFDVVSCLEVIEHVSDVNQLLESCATLVKPGGITSSLEILHHCIIRWYNWYFIRELFCIYVK